MKKKTNCIINWSLFAVWLLVLAVAGMMLAAVRRVNLLPGKYMALFVGVLAVLLLLIGLLLWLGRKGSKGGNVLRVIALLLAVVTVLGCFFGCDAATKLHNTLNAITEPVPTGVEMAVYVRRDDTAQTIADAADYVFGFVENYDTERTSRTLAEIEKELNKSIATQPYQTVDEMVNALYSGQVGAIILNSGYVGILEEMDGFTDFSEKTRVLYLVLTHNAADPTQPDPSESSNPTEPTAEEPVNVNIAQKPFVLYFSGSDTRYQTLRTSRSDVNILVVVNPQTKQVLLLNTPRDYYVPNPAGNGSMDKLTHCGIYGIQCSVNALADLYDISIDYYAQINFTGFETLIDAIGGVTVYSEYPFVAGKDTYIVEGRNDLNGKEALAFARDRKNGGGDTGRGRHQMQVITGVIQKVTSSTALITNYSQILSSLEGMFVTSMPSEQISELVKMQLDDMSKWNVLSYAVAGKNGSAITYSMPGRYLSVMFMNEEMVAKGSALVQKVLSGGILTEDDVK